MKKLLVLALIITSLSNAQEKAVEPAKRDLGNKYTFALAYRASEPGLLGLTLEVKQSEKNSFGFNTADYFTIALGVDSVTNGSQIILGSGFLAELGSRMYYKKESWSGFYTQYGFEGCSIKFSDVNYSGSYSYFSFFNPDLGFKWQVSKGFSIDPSIGCMWKIETKGRGDVDNNSFDTFVPKIGLKIGYSF